MKLADKQLSTRPPDGLDFNPDTAPIKRIRYSRGGKSIVNRSILGKSVEYYGYKDSLRKEKERKKKH